MPEEDVSHRTTNLLRQQINDLRHIAEGVEPHKDLDPSSRLFFESLQYEESQLAEELAVAEAREETVDLRFVLQGRPVVGHAVDAGFLGNFLSHIQGLVHGVAQAHVGEPMGRTHGRRKLAADYELRVAALVPGSFVVELQLPPMAEQMSLLLKQERDWVVDSIAALFTEDIVETRDQRDPFLTLLRHSRVKGHYHDLLKSLKAHEASMRLSTPGRPEGVEFSFQQADDRMRWLELQGEREEILEIEGTWVMGNVDSGRYELMAADVRYRGPVSEAALAEMKSPSLSLGSVVNARLRRVTHFHDDDLVEPKVEHILEAIRSK